MAKASGPDAALVVMILAAAFTGLAAVFAGWSAWASHRSAGSAERSARSAAEAVELERDRVHRELTPQIALEPARASGGDDEGMWFTNNGPLDYASVTFVLIQEPSERPIEGFLRGEDVLTRGDVGELAVGRRRFMRYRSALDEAWGNPPPSPHLQQRPRHLDDPGPGRHPR
jgi:type II secretory pathway pseudopilin PulG